MERGVGDFAEGGEESEEEIKAAGGEKRRSRLGVRGGSKGSQYFNL